MTFNTTLYNNGKRKYATVEAESAAEAANIAKTREFGALAKIRLFAGENYLLLSKKLPWVSVSTKEAPDTPCSEHCKNCRNHNVFVTHYQILQNDNVMSKREGE
ncbi:hypothetical protein SAMN05216391_11952 [Lachnospiraceae bacterium KHCPX20]|nr:hypothetical protein SAMN05216391_11952 [Lachnospiraceae bacterium KHCPX20]